MSKAEDKPKGLNILCIDSGGVRGLSSLIILQEVMRRTRNANDGVVIHPYEYFDVIAGTGTGGVSACMLGRLRMPIKKAIEEYAKFAREVFKEKKMSGPTMYKRKKLEEVLKTMIREATGDEKEMMDEGRGNTGCKTAVFAMARHNLNAGLPVMFRSYNADINPGPDCTIWEALYATMAHPDLFKSIEIIDSSIPQSFVGGEIGCSNPLTHVLNEVKRLHPERHIACIISIGAGHARTIQVPSPSRWYRIQDVVVMKDMATDSERVAEEMTLRFQDTSNVYFRFNIDQGMQNMKDGSWEKMGEAVQHAMVYMQKSETSQKLEGAVRAGMQRRGTVSTAHAAGQVTVTLDETKRLFGFKRCPAPTKFYTGREDENTQVINCITGGENELRVCVVYGLGGAGKTQLVLNVVQHTWDEWDHIIYVDASSPEAIERALKEFGAARSISQAHKDVIEWLESCGERWLVVFDNADTPSTNVRQYIPARGLGGSVLITTRLSDLARLAEGPDSVCHLSSMSERDGTALLVKISSSGSQCLLGNDLAAAGELVQDFGCLALAIVQAGAYIAHSPGMTISKYRYLFLTQRQRMLEEYHKLPAIAKIDERGDTVYTTWRMCYDQLKPESRELLWLVSYLHYDGISEEMFKKAAQYMHRDDSVLPLTELESQARDRVRQQLSGFLDSDRRWDTVKFAEVMADLAFYSLINFDRMNLTYRVHMLVHDWAKSVIPYSPELAVECTATLLALSIDWRKDTSSLVFKSHLGLHVTSVLTQSPDIGANHRFLFMEVYSCAGKWTQKEQLVLQLLEIFQRELGSDHARTWFITNALAGSHLHLGRWNQALPLQIQILDAYRRLYGEEHPETLNCMATLAVTYSYLGQYDKAVQLNVQELDLCKRVLGEDHPDTLNSMSILAFTYLSLGRHDEAEKLQVQTLNARRRVLGEEHPQTLSVMNNLVTTYCDQDRYNEAELLGTQVLNVQKRILGEEHPDTLSSMYNLAYICSSLGRHAEAEDLKLCSFEGRRKVLGAEHPDTLNSMSSLREPYSLSGEYDKLEEIEIQVFNIRKRVLREGHPEILLSLYNLAWIYSKLGRWDEARERSREATSMAERTLGYQHPTTEKYRSFFERMQRRTLVD